MSLVAYGSSDSFNVIAQDPTRMLTSDTHLGFNHVMGEWVTSVRGLELAPRPPTAYSDQSISTGDVRGVPALPPPLPREDLTGRSPHAGADGGFDVILSYDWASYDIPLPREGRRLGATMPEQTGIVRSLYNAAPAAYVEAQWTPHPSLRLVPGLGSTTTACSTPTSGRSIPAWRCAGP